MISNDTIWERLRVATILKELLENKLRWLSKQCLLVGYGHEEFGYRLLDPTTKKVIRSRDMIFLDEDQTVKDCDKAEKHKSDCRSYIDVVPKPPSWNFVDGGDIQVDNENAANDDAHDHDEPVQEVPPEPSDELEFPPT